MQRSVLQCNAALWCPFSFSMNGFYDSISWVNRDERGLRVWNRQRTHKDHPRTLYRFAVNTKKRFYLKLSHLPSQHRLFKSDIQGKENTHTHTHMNESGCEIHVFSSQQLLRCKAANKLLLYSSLISSLHILVKQPSYYLIISLYFLENVGKTNKFKVESSHLTHREQFCF